MYGIRLFRTLALMVLCFSPVLVQASVINLYADLSGAQEVPANASPGTGSAIITFDDVSNQLDWNIVFSDLSGPATAAHFHGPAAPGTNASALVNIGSISGLGSPMIGSTTISNANTADLLNGLWYINIHTALYPGGEIRGQVLQVVPLPASFLLLASGLVGLLGRRRNHNAA